MEIGFKMHFIYLHLGNNDSHVRLMCWTPIPLENPRSYNVLKHDGKEETALYGIL